jgi:hypothetical protein
MITKITEQTEEQDEDRNGLCNSNPLDNGHEVY